MTRKEAREQAFIIIFEKEFNNEYSLDEIIEAAKDAELFEADDFSKALAEKTLESLDKLDEIITANLKGGWKISRISKVSLAILRLAICEITQFTAGRQRSLEALYAAEEDASFINGLLASVSRGLNSDEA